MSEKKVRAGFWALAKKVSSIFEGEPDDFLNTVELETKQTLLKYNECQNSDLPLVLKQYYEENGISYKDYIGNGGPIKMDTEGVEINEWTLPKGSHQIKLNETRIKSNKN